MGCRSPQRHDQKPMKPTSLRYRIRQIALYELERCPTGMRFTELHRAIQATDPSLNEKTITGAIWDLQNKLPELVAKPSKGLFRHTKHLESGPIEPRRVEKRPVRQRVREDEFYPLFANWLRDELEEVTHAIALGGNVFKDRWGTPDVLGKNESRRSDVIKGPTSIVAAEIKIDLTGLVTGFGQACAYRLFAHKSYLVIPRQTAADELARIDSLCRMFGIGLVHFNARSPAAPDFRLVIRPVKQDPDLQYTNRYIRHVERELFS